MSYYDSFIEFGFVHWCHTPLSLIYKPFDPAENVALFNVNGLDKNQYLVPYFRVIVSRMLNYTCHSRLKGNKKAGSGIQYAVNRSKV